MMKALPDSVLQALRDQLRTAAVRELASPMPTPVSSWIGWARRVWSSPWSPPSSTMRLDVDAATLRAVSLFQSQDPFAGPRRGPARCT